MIIGDSWGVPNYPPTNYINDRIDKIKKISSYNLSIIKKVMLRIKIHEKRSTF